MNGRRFPAVLSWLLTLAIGIGIGTAIGQQRPPSDNKGLDAKLVGTVDLAPDMPGYQLRLRKLTFEPGGVVASSPSLATSATGPRTRAARR